MSRFNKAYGSLFTGAVIVACGCDTLDMEPSGSNDEATPSTADGGGNVDNKPEMGSGGSSFVPVVVDMTESGGSSSVGPEQCEGKSTGEEPLIDDLEDLNKFIPYNEGRTGWWEVFDDEQGVLGGKLDFTTGEGQGVDGSNARCVDAAGFNRWGTVISVGLGFPRCMYDASEYAGVCFEAKGTITSGDRLDFSVNTADTLGTEDGGRCDLTADASSCERFWHYKTAMRAEGTEADEGETLLDKDEYRLFCYTWDELQQDKDAPTPFEKNVTEIVQFEWKWPGGYPTEEVDEMGDPILGSTDGALCVDNIRFMTFDEVPDPPAGGAPGKL